MLSHAILSELQRRSGSYPTNIKMIPAHYNEDKPQNQLKTHHKPLLYMTCGDQVAYTER
jgi:hypothetical protein